MASALLGRVASLSGPRGHRRHPFYRMIGHGVTGSLKVPRVAVGRPVARPRFGAGGAGRLQVRRAGVMRGGDRPLMSWSIFDKMAAFNRRTVGRGSTGAGTLLGRRVQGEPKSPARGQPAQRLDGAMKLDAAIASWPVGMQRGARSGRPLPRLRGTTTHILRTARSAVQRWYYLWPGNTGFNAWPRLSPAQD